MKHFVQETEIATAPQWARPARLPAAPREPGDDDRHERLIAHEQRASLLRSECFDDLKLRNPLWDMLLDMLAAKRSGRQLSMRDLCAVCDAPESTALRLIHQLRDKGYAEMVPDRSDRRRTRVSLTGKGEARLDAYIARADAHPLA